MTERAVDSFHDGRIWRASEEVLADLHDGVIIETVEGEDRGVDAVDLREGGLSRRPKLAGPD